MGALQAQDFAMSKWAVGVRVFGATEKMVEEAISNATIIRTHLMRPTWHIVSQKDIYWMLSLTAPQIQGQLKSRHRELGITEDIIKQSELVIRKALSDQRSLTREELNANLEAAGIATNDQRSAHIFLAHELNALIASGTIKDKQATYAILTDKVKPETCTKPAEPVIDLARRYFHSHGPATIDDFIWWSGLQISRAKKAMEILQNELASATVDGKVFWYPASVLNDQIPQTTVHLLPAYDEFIISYKDRRAALPHTHMQKVLNKNGIFWPVVIQNGQVVGTWLRTVKKDKVLVSVVFFKPATQKLKRQVEEAAFEFGKFLGLKAEVKFE